MSAFEYVMVLVSIVVGLGVTHILSAVGAGVHRIRGLGPPLRVDLTYLAWVLFAFLLLISFWWWEFKLGEAVAEWTFGIYLLILGYAVSLFLLAVVLVPRDLDGVSDTVEYFLGIRRWFFGIFLLSLVIDVPDTLLKRGALALDPEYWAITGTNAAVSVIGIASTSRTVHRILALVILGYQILFMFRQLGVLETG